MKNFVPVLAPQENDFSLLNEPIQLSLLSLYLMLTLKTKINFTIKDYIK